MLQQRRKRIRLQGYDYRQAGAYFVTISTVNYLCLLSEIRDQQVLLSPIGSIISECLHEMGQRYPQAELDQFVVMPNHVHVLLYLNSHSTQSPLYQIIGAFKAASTRLCRQQQLLKEDDLLWMRSFHDRIVRNEEELAKFSRYIRTNPSNWELDRLNPHWRF